MLFLLRNGRLRNPILFLALLFTRELCHFPEMTEAYQPVYCEYCGYNYDDCSPYNSVVQCDEPSFCFKLYNTSINRLQKGCSRDTTESEFETVTKLGSASGKQSVCFDVTKANLEIIKRCHGILWHSKICPHSFETPQFNATSQQVPDVSKMTTKRCICQNNDKGPCNKGDVPGFEEIQRVKAEGEHFIPMSQCYSCSNDASTLCDDQSGKVEVTKWCRTKYCSFTKKRENSFRKFHPSSDGSKYRIIYNRGCADHYEDPAKTLECLKGNEGGCMNVKKLRRCSPIKEHYKLHSWEDYKEDDEGEDMKECICEGNLCNDKLKDDIKLDAGAETSVIFNKKLFILVVPTLFKAFFRIDGLGL